MGIRNLGNFIWPETWAIHREKRHEVGPDIELWKKVEREHRIDGKLVTPQIYDKSVLNHLRVIVQAFNEQFDPSHYRRCSGSRVVIDDGLQNYAYSSIIQTEPEKTQPVIFLSRGLLYSLEDLWQGVVSDNNCMLHLMAGCKFNENDPVLRNVEMFYDFDRFRFNDYTFLLTLSDDFSASIKKHYGEEMSDEEINEQAAKIGTNIHQSVAIKMNSSDPRRAIFADILADLSVQWILSHEDAHIYNAHTSYWDKILGVAPSELSPEIQELEAKVSNLLGSDQRADDAELRVLAELHADYLACFRLVDYLLDSKTFQLVSGLGTCVNTFTEAFQVDDENLGSAEQVRSAVIFWLSATVAVGSILLFQRNIEKKGISSIEYPDLPTRIINAVIATQHRITGRLKIPGEALYHDLDLPNDSVMNLMATCLSKDIWCLHAYALREPLLIQDPDLPTDKPLKFSELTGQDEEYQLIKTIFSAASFGQAIAREVTPVQMAAHAASSAQIKNWCRLQGKFHDRFESAFRPFIERLEFIDKSKIDESFHFMSQMSVDLNKAAELADLLEEKAAKP